MKRELEKERQPVTAAFLAAGVFILVVALGLRLWGIGYGLPFVVHPDENRQVLDSLGMAQRLSFIPAEFSYPALHKYLLIAVDGLYYAVGRVLGWFSDPSDFALKFLEGSSSVFLLGRLLSAVTGVLVCLAAWRMAARLFSRQAGLLALIFTAGMYHLIQHSQWAIADIFLALFTTLGLFYAMQSAEEEPCSGSFIRACICSGLAVSTKPQGLFLIVPLLISQHYSFRISSANRMKALFSARYLVAVGLFVIASVIGNLAWLVEFPVVFEKFRMLSQVALVGISSREPFTPGLLTLIPWFMKELGRQEGPLGAVLIAGVLYALFRRTSRDIIYLSYLAVFMFAVKDWAIRYLHLFVAVFPVMCVFGARAVAEAIDVLGVRQRITVALGAALVLHSVAGSVDASLLKSGQDTRLEAKSWMERNIPAGSTVAMDWYEFAVPLFTETPVYMTNPKASGYYEKTLPKSIKAGYANFLSDKTVYNVIPVIYSTDEPNWPVGMDPDAIRKASSKEVYRELYSVFNFTPVEELKRQGVSYLVITSYGYTNFLLDSDPAKNSKAVFNYLYKEDLLSFNAQADEYIDDGRYGLLYFLNKRARDFYVPLLEGRKAHLMKEFKSSDTTTGPVIGVYRFD